MTMASSQRNDAMQQKQMRHNKTPGKTLANKAIKI
jgi:hypothetical protein